MRRSHAVNPLSLSSLMASLALFQSIHAAHGDGLTIVTTARESGDVMPARLHVTGRDGRPVRSQGGLPFWRDHVASPGQATFPAEPGRYSVTAERGPEWSSESAIVELSAGQAGTNLTIALHRLANLPAEGWWPGELHIHRPLDEVELTMRAEDLYFGQAISWWNAANPWTNQPPPSPSTVRFDGQRFVQRLGGEDERDGGALLFGRLDRPIDITAGQRHFPSSLVYAREAAAAGAWIDIEKPFWWDVPMWIGNRIGDSIGIANNHMQRSGVYPGEAWGRPRDPVQYSGTHGNGLWSQDIYYHLLNAGVRLPPSAGAASGVLPNPVGYNRVYVQIEGEPTPDKWWSGLKAGRVFVSNGPLLRVTANHQPPGHVFTSASASLELTIDGRLDSRDSIARVELVRNGTVETIRLPARVTFEASGWFLVRAIASLTNTFRFASTGPFYVELQGARQSPGQRASAEFFVRWCDERLAFLATQPSLDDARRARVTQPWREARAFWETKADAARPDGSQRRPPRDRAETSAWLNDMLDHAFTRDEMRQVTGHDPTRLEAELAQLERRPRRPGLVHVTPYPGGRHPRRGFLEGALAPQRETKISVFTPWDPTSYVVVDVPEALWSNLGLTYLAHTHIDTVWDRQGVKLPQLEWIRQADGSLRHERTLPNGIGFGAIVRPGRDSVAMELWMKNGTTGKLTDLRVQNCVMLKAAGGFSEPGRDERRLDKPFALARSADGQHWIVTAWTHCDRSWTNPPVPCIHSDPRFPDLAPGETGRLEGWLWFHEGPNIEARLAEWKTVVEKVTAAR